ncbi:MAG: TolC family protein [Vicinamibacteria bacterium]|nr:TolC family protein [Vicinamibacteria bacterium]
MIPRVTRNPQRCLSVVCTASLLTACASIPYRGLATSAPRPEAPGEKVALTQPVERMAARASTAQTLPLPRTDAPLTLAAIIDIALARSPLTRASYALARAAAAGVAVERGAYFPELNANGNWSRNQAALDDPSVAAVTSYGAALSLTHLLLDGGGREAEVEEARQNLLAADWRARMTLKQTQAGLDAASIRHDAGVATIADVLQARTAVAQAQLNVDGLKGQVMTVRGALATSMGLAADLPFDTGELPATVPLGRAQPKIDVLIRDARLARPDLAALRALARKSAAHVASVRADLLPRLTFTGNLNRITYQNETPALALSGWQARLDLQIPIFDGRANAAALRRAQEERAAQEAQVEGYEQQVALQVWTSYYALETATQRVHTTQVLLVSATQSEQVALGRYREGVGTVLDLLLAQSALASARAQEIQARADWLIAMARLAHDAGRLPLADETVIVTEETKNR